LEVANQVGSLAMAGFGKAVPLLKFDKSEKGELHPDGVAKIKAIPAGGTIYPVIFIGDGRGGKSYLASRLTGDPESFASSDSAEPVTEGIDIVVGPVAKLLAEVGIPIQKGGRDTSSALENQHLLVLDCEGGNNALAAIRTLVNVFGIVIGPQVVFVASGMASEQALQMLAASLAASSLINLEGSKMPSRRLNFVVNKNTLQYKEDALQKMLDMNDSTDAARAEVRQSIKDSFEEREFTAIPMMGMPNFEEKVKELRKTILENRRVLNFSGAPCSGESLAGLLELIQKEIHASNTVSFPSMHRYVILDGFLIPTAFSMAEAYEADLPQLDDYDADLESKNAKSAVVKAFNDRVDYVGQPSLISEARRQLEEMLDRAWEIIADKNKVFGDQVKEMKSETREIVAESKVGPIGGRGLLKNVSVTMQKMKVESRAVIIRKRGGDPEFGPWVDTGSSTTRILESAFESYAQLPVLKGKLFKRSPNILRTLFGKAQERSCMLKDGHFLWWSQDKASAKAEASGCVNFLINRAQVISDPSNPTTFIIKPASDAGWADVSTFSGGENRDFMFDCTDSEMDVAEWIKGIKQHITFADAAYKDLGDQKVRDQVGIQKPTLAQVDG
jgi:hypothetical protein